MTTAHCVGSLSYARTELRAPAAPFDHRPHTNRGACSHSHATWRHAAARWGVSRTVKAS